MPVVQVPPRGVWGESGQATLAPTETWLGRPLDPDPSPEELVLRYLGAFGPATVMDVQAWCGLTRLGEVAERLRPRLRVLRDEGGRELFDVPGAPLPDPETPAPVRFLPEFDNVLLSHADRSRVVGSGYRPPPFAGKGGAVGSVLVDGFFRATYSITRQRGSANLLVTQFGRLSEEEMSAVTEEGARLLAFVAARADTHDIGFDQPE